MVNSDTILLECEYMPCVYWFTLAAQHSHLSIDAYENFEKATLRNRCYVAGPHGPVMLSIPIEGGRNHKSRMKDVRISYHERWQHIHWQTLISCYGRAPYFEYYTDYLQPLYSRQPDFLLDFNISCLEVIWKLLSWQKSYALTESPLEGKSPLDLRREIRASNYSFYRTKPYHQVFSHESFYPNLSILDLLLCEGRRAVDFMEIHSTANT